jgi:hypothetical protein
MPKRRYIPSDGQKFVSEITEEIEAIINDFKPTISTEEVDIDINLFLGKDKGTISETTENESQSNVGIDDLFSDDLIEDLLLNAIRRGN